MPILLNIDTATEVASVCISHNDDVLSLLESHQQREHASFIHIAIQQCLDKAAINIQQINAIAVTAGPGSYTGLRVGLATAKGLCYTLQKPLITLNTLEVMTQAAQQFINDNLYPNPALYCPMIDARRMEVFTALYSHNGNEIMKPCAKILDESSFDSYMTENSILFFGNGSAKFQELISHKNASFQNIPHNASHLVGLARQAFTANKFSNLAYAEPDYLKEFYTPANKMKY